MLIIGCGFAGLFAARRLCREKKLLAVTVFDRKKTFDFLPLLPDVIGRGLEPDYLDYSLLEVGRRLEFRFINAEVKRVDLEQKEIFTDEGGYRYDYLLISSGAETDFYGNDAVRRNAYKLYKVADAVRLKLALSETPFDVCLVSGGGYTGVETAAAINRFLRQRDQKQKVVLIEKASRIINASPEWLSAYASRNLENMGVKIMTNAVVKEAGEESVLLSNGAQFKRPLLVWTAGVKTPDFTAGIKADKNSQGRLSVDPFLRLTNTCFAAGDVAMFNYRGACLRMAAQFAISEAVCAAENIIRSTQGRPLAKYRPFDLGYIIPMANNHSCGIVLGVRTKGYFPTLLHFFMSIYRSFGKNRLGLFRQLAKEVLL